MRTLFTIAVLFQSTLLCAQPGIYFSKNTDLLPNIADAGNEVVLIPGGYAMITGQGPAYGTTLIHTDYEGNFTHTRHFTGAPIVAEGLIYEPTDSTFLIWGTRVGGTFWSFPFLIKTTFWGDTIWSREYDIPFVDNLYNTIKLPNGNYVLAVTSSVSGNRHGSALYVSAEGELLWQRRMHAPFQITETQGLAMSSDSTIRVGYIGHNWPDTIDVWQGYGLVDIDFEGNIVKDTIFIHFVGPAFNRVAGNLVRVSEDRYAYVRESDEFTNFGVLPGLYMIDQDMKPIWSSKITELIVFGEAVSGLPGLIVNDKGNIVGCGDLYYSPEGSDDTDIYAWFFEIDPNGQLLWERTIRPVLGEDYWRIDPRKIKQTPDGGYIVCGAYIPAVSAPSLDAEISLVKLDSNGCLQPGCFGDLATVSAFEPGAAEAGFEVFPNPANHQLLITHENGYAGHIRLFDLQGRQLLQQPFGGSPLSIPVQHIPNGVYLVQYQGEASGSTTTRKVTIQH